MSNLLTFPARAYARLRDVQLARTAASLSFTTLLALVPLASVALAFVSRFPMFERGLAAFEAFLVRDLLPGSGAALVHDHVVRFAEQAARLSGVSIVLVAVTAGLALHTMEREINAIWGIRHGRSLPRRVVLYALGLTAGPVLIGAAISITTWAIAQSLAVVPLRKTFGESIVRALPFAFFATGLTLLYRFVPARHVRLAAALAGGVTAALALEGAKHAFTFYVTHLSMYHAVYGALSALPVFLVWLYLCWIIVLAGAAISAALPDGGRRARA
ncbi:MAG TPA: YihY family inner membrane protein [Casimicrobiaceae bacterium]